MPRDRAGDRMGRPSLGGRCNANQIARGPRWLSGHYLGNFERAFRQRPGLVEGHHVHPREPFEVRTALDENPVSGSRRQRRDD